MMENENRAAESQADESGVSRREFIKGAGAAAGLAMAAGCATTGKNVDKAADAPAILPGRKIGPNDMINIGVIGVGGRGFSDMKSFMSQSKSCRIVAVCDCFQKRITRAQEECAKRGMDVKTFLNHSDLLDLPEVDAVIVATPDHWHAPIAIEAMKKGKDVYCEKPMTHTIAEAREMAELSEKLGRVVQVGSQTTSANQWTNAKKAISDGMIGKMLMSQGSYHRNSDGGEWNYGIDHEAGPDKTGENYIDWEHWQKPAENKYEWYAPRFFRFRKYWDYSGGVATDLFFHVMAPMNLCWPEPEFPWRASGMGGIYAFDDGREVPDTFMLAADYPSGHSVVLSSSMANSHHIPGLIRGHEGTIVMTEHGAFEGSSPYITVTPENIGKVKENFVTKYGSDSVQIKTAMTADPMTLHVKNFLDCIRTREEPTLSARKAYRVQVAITLGIDSYRAGKVLYFDAATQTPTDRRPASTMKLANPGVINGANVVEPDFGPANAIRKGQLAKS